jgi:hypothetical protein
MSSASQWASKTAVATAESVVAGDAGILDGCRLLASLAHDLVSDWSRDDDFVVFGAVASEGDNFPGTVARAYWNPVALEREDRKIANFEATYREQVLKACRSVVARFGAPASEGSDV